MKILLFGDWPLATTYLDPLHDYIRATEPDWEVGVAGNIGRTSNYLNKPDVVITCDELSVAPDAPLKVCIFHGMASKAQAFSTIRKNQFVEKRQDYAVPSAYYRDLLIGLGVSEDRIFVSGLTKHDSLERKVLYAPTHNHQLSAIPVVQDRIYEIPNVKVHLHMYTRTGKQEIHEKFRSFYPVHEDREDISDLLVWADTVIGDMGSIVIEALALGKRGIQVRNPAWMDYYKEHGVSDSELVRLPEVHIPQQYGLVVDSVETLLDAVNIAPVGGASAKIVDWIKQKTIR